MLRRSRKLPMTETIRVLIADDHEVVRDGLRLILETEMDFCVVGEAADGAQAVQLTGALQPQVVLMDLRMPGMDGLTAIDQIRAQWPAVALVILTTYNEDELMMRGLRAGACGYLLKDTNRQSLFATLRAAARGEVLLKPEVLARVLGQRQSRDTQTASGAAPGSTLTAREQAVLQAVARGARSKEIAVLLQISERTVKAHLASIYNKLGVDSRAAAIALAAQRGWLDGV
jgi:NarL family two-component system response regulator YdfI